MRAAPLQTAVSRFGSSVMWLSGAASVSSEPVTPRSHARKGMQMTTETLNGIDVPALKAIADSVKNNPDQRTVAFRVKTAWKGQTKSVTTVSDYMLGGETFSRRFEIHAERISQRARGVHAIKGAAVRIN